MRNSLASLASIFWLPAPWSQHEDAYYPQGQWVGRLHSPLNRNRTVPLVALATYYTTRSRFASQPDPLSNPTHKAEIRETECPFHDSSTVWYGSCTVPTSKVQYEAQ